MKKYVTNSSFRITILLLFGLISSEIVNAQYCEPSNINNNYSDWTFYVSNVALGDLSNSSTGNTGSFIYYSSLGTTDITVGENLTGSISVKMNGWNTQRHTISVWLNFNSSDDTDFEDGGEQFRIRFRDNNNVAGIKTVDIPISIPIPANTQLGLSRMRIGLRDAPSNNFSSCNYQWNTGEVEDYNINFVTSLPPEPVFADTDGDGITDNIDVDDDNDGILDTSEGYSECIDDFFINGDFEDGPTLPNSYSLINENFVDGWSTVSNDNRIEIWRSGFNGVTSQSGNYHSELNANRSAALYQRICTIPGSEISWSVWHRGRNGVDVAAVKIGNQLATASVQATMSTNNRAWVQYSGTYQVPSTDTETYIIFDPISTAGRSRSSGNFIDNVVISVDLNDAFLDTDGDTIPDYLDIDSDNDGIPDNIEGQPTLNYLTPSGSVNTSGSYIGLWDNYGTGIVPQNTDATDQPDYLDLDSDNDGTPDIEENGMANSISGIDTDMDGLDDSFEGSNSNDPMDVNDEINDPADLSVLPDSDGDLTSGGDLDYRDLFNINPPPLAAIDFDGVDDYIDTPLNLSGYNQLTTMVWVKLDPSFSSEAVVLSQGGFEILITAARRVVVRVNNIVLNFPNTDRIKLNEWTHLSLLFDKDLATDQLKGYVNGELVALKSDNQLRIPVLNSSERLTIGKKAASNSGYFIGEIDEVRIFDQVLTQDQINTLLYQEIEENSSYVSGTTISKIVLDNDPLTKISWSALKGYYPMTNIKSSSTSDFSGANNDGKLHNITGILEQTAPMPYQTSGDGDFSDRANWLYGDVWNMTELTESGRAIVKVSNNVIVNSDLKTFGLIIDAEKTLTMNGSFGLRNSWYLGLNGTIDLKDDSQLIQTNTSDLVTSVNGKILRRQEGTPNKFWYNYWSSPVGSTAAATISNNNSNTNNSNNSNFSLNMLKDGAGNNVQFTNQLHAVGKISTRWLYTFRNGVTYFDWGAVNPSTSLEPGVAYTQKGTGVSGSEQQYLFEGKPNNGTITINVTDAGGVGSEAGVSRTDYLLGNPYPSALDLHQFIDDNEGILIGTIKLWQQWSGSSHNLSEYEGGYANVNKLGATRAYQFAGINGGHTGEQNGTKIPTKYLPVGQGFMAEIIGDGEVVFRNSQRVFIKEAHANGNYNNGSVFFRGANNSSSDDTTAVEEIDAEEQNLIQKLRLEFNSVSGPPTRRELLLGFSDTTTDGYDYGYDSKNSDVLQDDLNLVLNEENMLMQAYGPITQDKIIPLNLKSSGSNSYTIQITETENIEEDQEIYIKDKFTSEYFDLRNGQIYEFSSEEGEFAERLEIVFQSGSQSLSQTDEAFEDLNLYYSSGRNRIVVLNPNNIELISVEVFNISGQSVYQNKDIYQSTYNEFELNNLSSGGYVVQLVTTGNATMTKKIIVN